MKHLLLLAILALAIPTYAQTPIFDCVNNFTQDGACGAQEYGYNYAFNENGGSVSVVNGHVQLMPNPGGHTASALIYVGPAANPNGNMPVNVQAFTASWAFVPNGVNHAFVLENTNNVSGDSGIKFVAGAGAEAGFYQPYTPPEPNNVFALELDSNSPLSVGASFTYSSAMYYSSNQSPCTGGCGTNSDPIPTKISTYPVPLNSPAGTANTTTGHTYSATLTYDGSDLTLNLFDVTAGGSCPGSTCFTHTWSNVNIPAIVGGDTAYVGLTAGSNSNTVAPLFIDSFSYTSGAVVAPPPPTIVATPTFSPAAGTYTSAQTVILSDTTSGASIFYAINGGTVAAYTKPLSVGATETITAYATATGDTQSATASAAYTISVTPPPTVTLSIPAQTLPISIQTSNGVINATITIPAQTLTLPQ